MSGRIERSFANLKKAGRAGLVTFVMAGDPDQALCAEALDTLASSGADVIELGMPFTDPVADGPAIQEAGLRALGAGANLKIVLSLAAAFRARHGETPLILMGYYNPIHAYGVKAFAADAAAAGVDGLIVVDLPMEEEEELGMPLRERGLRLIRLITPVTDDARLERLLQKAEGFLYYVSITGITGTAQADEAQVLDHIARIQRRSDLPIAIGFGIRTPADAARMAPGAQAVVVGTSIVQTIDSIGQGSKSFADLAGQVRDLADALKSRNR